MGPLWVELAALALYGPLVVLLHELGHAGFARLGGYRVTSFAIGTGRPVWRRTLRSGVVVHLDTWLLTGGSCTAIPLGPEQPRRAWFHGGGLLVQGGLALALWAAPDTWMLARIAQFNWLVAMTNALPWRWGPQASDGWYLARIVTRRGWGGLLAHRAALDRLATLESRLGAELGQAYAELCLAWTDVLTGRLEAASAFFARPVPRALAEEPWLDALHHHVRSAWHQQLGRPLAALGELRAVRWYRGEARADAANDLLTVSEASALLSLGEPRRARELLARLAGVSGGIADEAAALHLWAALLADDPAPVVVTAARRVQARLGTAWLDPAQVVGLLWQAGDVLSTEEEEAAAACRQDARRLARRTLSRAPVDVRGPLAARLGEAAGVRPLAGLASPR